MTLKLKFGDGIHPHLSSPRHSEMNQHGCLLLTSNTTKKILGVFSSFGWSIIMLYYIQILRCQDNRIFKLNLASKGCAHRAVNLFS